MEKFFNTLKTKNNYISLTMQMLCADILSTKSSQSCLLVLISKTANLLVVTTRKKEQQYNLVLLRFALIQYYNTKLDKKYFLAVYF